MEEVIRNAIIQKNLQIGEMKLRLAQMAAQRDELLAACEAVLADAFREVDMQSWAAPMVAQLRAAIANAKGD